VDSEEASESRGSYTSQKHIEEHIQIAKKLMELYKKRKAMEQLIILTLSSKAKKKVNRNCRGQCTTIQS
jgi:hypothetical protein